MVSKRVWPKIVKRKLTDEIRICKEFFRGRFGVHLMHGNAFGLDWWLVAATVTHVDYIFVFWLDVV